MSIARIHHYIPRCYLKGFASGSGRYPQTFVVDLAGRRSFPTSIKNVCGVRDFNRLDIPGLAPDALEIQLAKFDSELGSALQTISRMRSLEDEQAKLVLLNFASVAAVRNPGLRARMEDFHTRLYEIVGDLAVSTRERYEALLNDAVADGDVETVPHVKYEDVRDFVRKRKYELHFPHGFHVATEFTVQDTVLRTMLARKWILLRAPQGTQFITSDMPVCIWPNEPTRFPVGYGLKNTTVVLPVTSSLLAMGMFDGREGVFDAPRSYVATLNLALALRCDRLVFARSPTFEVADSDNKVTVGPELVHRIIASRRQRRNRKGKRGVDAGQENVDPNADG